MLALELEPEAPEAEFGPDHVVMADVEVTLRLEETLRRLQELREVRSTEAGDQAEPRVGNRVEQHGRQQRHVHGRIRGYLGRVRLTQARHRLQAAEGRLSGHRAG